MTSEEFKTARIKLNLLQREMAEALGVTPRTVRGYEAGWKIPDRVEKMLALLGKPDRDT